jgi:hypothetical protein
MEQSGRNRRQRLAKATAAKSSATCEPLLTVATSCGHPCMVSSHGGAAAATEAG